jgi:hypothetical protein
MFSKNENNELLAACVAVLRQGAQLLAEIDDETYLFSETGATGRIGTHFRHCLDFYKSFLAGARAGKIDYAKRERDAEIEENRRYAIACFELIVAQLESFPIKNANQPLMVKAEDAFEEIWFPSSLARELEFVRSHTVHHFALIAFKLALRGVKVSENFGVAPSTLRFWAAQKASAKV